MLRKQTNKQTLKTDKLKLKYAQCNQECGKHQGNEMELKLIQDDKMREAKQNKTGSTELNTETEA